MDSNGNGLLDWDCGLELKILSVSYFLYQAPDIHRQETHIKIVPLVNKSYWYVHAYAMNKIKLKLNLLKMLTLAGLEPAIPWFVVRCLIHWATGPVAVNTENFSWWCKLLHGERAGTGLAAELGRWAADVLTTEQTMLCSIGAKKAVGLFIVCNLCGILVLTIVLSVDVAK